MSPPHPHVSRLSAALRRRTVHEDELTRETLAEADSWQSIEKWLQEVWWRRYWKGRLEHQTDAWHNWCSACRWPLADEEAMATLPSGMRRRIEQVEQGASGVAVMDAFARELRATGYLHNHARMWFASFWIHVENLPWWWGARFFLRHLIDADPASNTLSWRWVAGHQTAGKTYLVRRSNLERWCDPEWLDQHRVGLERLDDSRVQARQQPEWPEDMEPVPPGANARPAPVEEVESWLERAHDTVSRSALLLHEEECCWENGPFDQADWGAVILLTRDGSEGDRAEERPAEAAHRIALNDTWQRMRARWPDRAFTVPSSTNEQTPDQVADLAGQRHVRQLIVPAAFAGPVASRFNRLRRQITDRGFEWTELRRSSDQLAIDSARRGFFPFWKQVSRHLEY